MKNKILGALFSLTTSLTFALPVNEMVLIGNGGDAIFCENTNENNYSGYYALDYLATLSDLPEENEFAAIENWKQSSDRIIKLLTGSANGMLEDFYAFSNSAFATNHVDSPYEWRSKKFGLVELGDENLVGLLPQNCNKKIQAVVRQTPELAGLAIWRTAFNYNAELLKQLEQTSPLQLSFLLVHEFLWGYTKNVNAIREVTKFLHLQNTEKLTRHEIRDFLISKGITIPSYNGISIYEIDTFNGPQKTTYLFDQLSNNQLGEFRIFTRERECTSKEGCSKEWKNVLSDKLPSGNMPWVRDGKLLKIAMETSKDAPHDLHFRLQLATDQSKADFSCKKSKIESQLEFCSFDPYMIDKIFGDVGEVYRNLIFKGKITTEFLIFKNDSIVERDTKLFQRQIYIVLDLK